MSDNDRNKFDWQDSQNSRQGRENNDDKNRGGKQPSIGSVVLLAVVTALVLGSVIFSFFGGEARDYSIPVSQLLEESQDAAQEQTETQALPSADTTASQGKGPLDVSDVAEAMMPCVVAITSESVQTVEYFYYGTREIPQESVGSGILIGQSEEELFIGTNYHVIEGADSITISFSAETDDVEEVIAEGLQKGFDAERDLAVVAVKLADIPDHVKSQIRIAVLGDSEDLVVGQRAIAIGNALGYGQSVTAGVVSAVNREGTVDGVTQNYIQTDAAINFGNSGGALLNEKGEVIGINSAKVTEDGAERMGYAIPINEAKPIFAQLSNRETREKVDAQEQGSLGIETQNVSDAAQSIYQIPSGAFVSRVEAGSAGETGGLLAGDIITELDGIAIKDADALDELLQYYRAGETVEVVSLSRDSGYEPRTLTITLQEAGAGQEQAPEDEGFGGYGMPGNGFWGSNGWGWY